MRRLASFLPAEYLADKPMTDYIVEDIWEFQSLPAAPARCIDATMGGTQPFRSGRMRDRLPFRPSDSPPWPLTMMKAPAGYGKSSLLRQWAHELTLAGYPSLSITIDREHATVTLGVGRHQSATQLEDHRALMPFIRNWLDRRAWGTVLIDDAHLMPDAIVQMLCTFFLQVELHNHALVVSTRRPIAVPLARARALKLVRDIGARDLRLTAEELKDFAHAELGAAPDPRTLSEIAEATGGWPAAVGIYLQRAREIGPTAVLRELQRGSRFMDDFFAEEILQPLPAPLQDFLIGSSALGTLTADVCNAALEINDGAELLDEAERAGLFIDAIDGCGRDFRLHKLFATYLQTRSARRDRAQHDMIALRGADWFERNNQFPEAFDCAVHAQAWDRAAALLDAFGMRGCLTGQGELVTAMALRLPKDILRQHPRAAVFAARGASTGWRFGLVEDFLRLADETALRNSSAEIEDLILHSRMLSAQYEDNQIVAEQKCVNLLKRIDSFDHYTRGTIFGSLLYARREQFDFSGAAELEATGVREFNLSGRLLGMVWHLSVVGPTHGMRGDLPSAARRLEEAAKIAADQVEAEWIASVPSLLLAEICYERNELARAQELLDRHFPAPRVGFIDQYVAGFITGAKLLWRAGNIEGAHRRLDEGMTLAESRSLERLRQAMIGERIRQLLACGEQQRASEIGRREQLLGSYERILPQTDCTTRDEMRAISWFRLAVARGEVIQATELGQIWKRFTAKAGAVRSAMRWELLLSRSYAARGQIARAQRELRGALTRAVNGGFIRSFLDEGEPIMSLLREQLGASQIQTSATDILVFQLLQASAADLRGQVGAATTLGGPERSQNSEPLTRTEIEILQMAGAGLQNREIAQRIGTTEGSVKWYMQQIFDKIGIRKRAGALDRARALGLVG
jgi:LuxR family transcriptional regulator, maltose regulon positive regulatory protein